jgi:hypothetical protein
MGEVMNGIQDTLNIWPEYEKLKQQIDADLTPEEYEKEIKRICDELIV